MAQTYNIIDQDDLDRITIQYGDETLAIDLVETLWDEMRRDDVGDRNGVYLYKSDTIPEMFFTAYYYYAPCFGVELSDITVTRVYKKTKVVEEITYDTTP